MSEVIVITSGKGGVGKTTTTANVGTGLAMLDKKVIMIDTDIGLRNLDVVMGLENRIVYNLVDVVEGKCRIRQALIKDKKLLLIDDSIVRGTQLRDNVKILYDYGAKEVHMRIACPPLIYSCPFLGFTASKGDLELITRRMIKEIEGDENKDLEKYAATDSPQYQKMVQMIADRFGLTSLKFNTLETLIEAIGLPKCKVCTHCFDGSSCF